MDSTDTPPEREPSSFRRRHRGIAIAATGVALAFLAWAAARELRALPNARVELRWGWIALSVLALAILQASHAGLWRLILADLGARIPGWESRAIWNVSQLARYVPTGLLMAASRVVMAERAGVRPRTTVASMIYELALALVAASLIGAVFFIRIPAVESSPARFAIFLVPLAGLVLVHPRVFQPLADWAARQTGRASVPLSMRAADIGSVTVLYGITFLIGGCGSLAMSAGLYPIEASDVPTLVGAYAVGFAAGLLGFFMPGGLGIREAGLSAALALVLPPAIAITVGIALRLVQIVIEIIYAALFSWLARRRRNSSVSPSEAGVPIS